MVMKFRILPISIFITCAACNRPPTTQQVGAVTDASCTLLRAFADSPEEEAICATIEDANRLAEEIRKERADAGSTATKKADKCQIVGTICATDAELARAIKATGKKSF
jgi:hypothetical protein